MLLYIRINDALKSEVDKLVSKGDYTDFNSAAVTAIENLVTAERENSAARIPGSLPLQRSEERQGVMTSQTNFDLSWTSVSNVPDKLVLPLPPDLFGPGEIVPVERWIFGQQNRAFPAKVNARLLVNLIAIRREAVELAEVAHEISVSASKVGVFLSNHDEKRRHKKDDLLSTGFPEPRSDKSMSRYANHFVAYENTQGSLSGMMIEWKLAGVKRLKNKTYLLPTNACIELATFKNALLDHGVLTEPPTKFSGEELDYLLNHLRLNVPVESSAFTTVLDGIRSGADNPDSLDEYVRGHANEKREMTKAFTSTQRSGAVSRMADLDLLVRVRDGIRISYQLSERGTNWLETQTKQNPEQ
jgi:hypothetical protein